LVNIVVDSADAQCNHEDFAF